MKRRLVIAGGAVAALVCAFLAGRYSRPAEVRETVKVETRTEWKDRVVEKVVYREKKDKQRHVETKTEKKPTGEVVITRVEDSRSQSDGTGTREGEATQQGSGSTTTTTTKIVRDRASWRASLSADWGSLELHPEFYGVSVERRVLGPLWLGMHARSDRSFGLSLGMEF